VAVERRADGIVRALGLESRAPFDLLRAGAPPPSKATPPRVEPRAQPDLPLIAVKRFRIADGRFTLVDRGVDPDQTFTLSGIDVSLRNLSTAGLRGDPPPAVNFSASFAAENLVRSARADGVLKVG